MAPRRLRGYRGKVLLLDFWATWCHGCKEEIPWFTEIQKKYGSRGLRVVGVSVDEGGWSVLKPFLASTGIPYTMLLGNGPLAQQYGIDALPDTFLIDRHGKIAAVYRGLVDWNDLESHLKAMLSER